MKPLLLLEAIPYALRLVFFLVGCGMLAIPLLSTAFQSARGSPRDKVTICGVAACGIGILVCLVIYLSFPGGIFHQR